MPDREQPAEERSESWLRAIAALVSPTLLGIFVILSVITGEFVGKQVNDSEVVSSVALVVGAALILGSALIYVRAPTAYQDHEQINAEQLEALFDQAQALRSLSNRLAEDQRTEPRTLADATEGR